MKTATSPASKKSSRPLVATTDASAPRAVASAKAASRKVTSTQKAAAPIAKNTKQEKAAKADTVAAPQQAAKKPRARRAALPDDFAEQYSREPKRKLVAVTPAKPNKRARRTAAERAEMRRAIAPDDDFLRRLAAVNAIGGSSSGGKRKAGKARARHWELRCGKCGTVSTFETAAALCGKCGAIAMKDATEG